MTETAFPIVGQDLTNSAWKQTVGSAANGILDDGGGPYSITVNTNDTVTLRVSTKTGFARAVVSGFGHQIDANVTLPVPAVSSRTWYHIGLLYDPANTTLPVKLVVLKGDTVPLTDGQVYLPIYTFDRQSGQTLAAAKLYSPKPRLRPTMYMASESDLKQPGMSPLLFLYGTEVVLGNGDRYIGKGSNWELQATLPTTGTVTAASGYKISASTYVRKQDGIVDMYIAATGSFPRTNKRFAAIPAGFRPAQQIIAPALLTAQDFPEAGGITIGTDGAVVFYGAYGQHASIGAFVRYPAA